MVAAEQGYLLATGAPGGGLSLHPIVHLGASLIDPCGKLGGFGTVLVHLASLELADVGLALAAQGVAEPGDVLGKGEEGDAVLPGLDYIVLEEVDLCGCLQDGFGTFGTAGGIGYGDLPGHGNDDELGLLRAKWESE